ncbi:unnamed protein product [Victoria cruziana]
MGRMAEALGQRRVKGSLPSQPLGNPKGKGPVFVIEEPSHTDPYDVSTLRSGREYQPQPQQHQQQQPYQPPPPQHYQAQPPQQKQPSTSTTTTATPSRGATTAPYANRLVIDREVWMRDMLEMFRVVRINLPLLDAIQQVPAYSRFLKELCTKKRRSRKVPECVLLNEEISSLLQRRLPPKLEDPGAPIIPCVLRHIRVERAFLDLRASVNILPGFFYDVFGLEGLRPTSMTIQMADRSVKAPRGVFADVLLKIESFIFPVDFVVLDMEGVDTKYQTPIILGRPFLATLNACINCRTGVLEISFAGQKLRLNIFHAAMGPAGDRCISFAEGDTDDVDDAAHEIFMAVYMSSIADHFSDVLPGADVPTMLYHSSLGLSSSDFDISSHDPSPIVSSLDHTLSDDLASFHPLSLEGREADGGSDDPATTILHRNRSHPSHDIESSPPIALDPAVSSSLESPPAMELKPLPHTLKYAYMGSNDSLPVIISSVLSFEEDGRLLSVLRGHQKAIGW